MPYPSFTASLVGTHFRNASAKQFVATIERGQLLSLERESDNEYDVNAIKVISYINDEPLHLGYIERGVAAFLAFYIDEGAEYIAEVIAINKVGRNMVPELSCHVEGA